MTTETSRGEDVDPTLPSSTLVSASLFSLVCLQSSSEYFRPSAGHRLRVTTAPSVRGPSGYPTPFQTCDVGSSVSLLYKTGLLSSAPVGDPVYTTPSPSTTGLRPRPQDSVPVRPRTRDYPLPNPLHTKNPKTEPTVTLTLPDSGVRKSQICLRYYGRHGSLFRFRSAGGSGMYHTGYGVWSRNDKEGEGGGCRYDRRNDEEFVFVGRGGRSPGNVHDTGDGRGVVGTPRRGGRSAETRFRGKSLFGRDWGCICCRGTRTGGERGSGTHTEVPCIKLGYTTH